MVSWLFFALLSPLLFALANVIDKVLLGKRIRNPYAYGALVGATYLSVVAITIPFIGIPELSFPVLAVGLLAGVCSGIMHLMYR